MTGDKPVFFGGAVLDDMNEPLVSAVEVARLLGVTQGLATALLASEAIPGVQIGVRRYAIARPLLAAKSKGKLTLEIKVLKELKQ